MASESSLQSSALLENIANENLASMLIPQFELVRSLISQEKLVAIVEGMSLEHLTAFFLKSQETSRLVLDNVSAERWEEVLQKLRGKTTQKVTGKRQNAGVSRKNMCSNCKLEHNIRTCPTPCKCHNLLAKDCPARVIKKRPSKSVGAPEAATESGFAAESTGLAAESTGLAPVVLTREDYEKFGFSPSSSDDEDEEPPTKRSHTSSF